MTLFNIAVKNVKRNFYNYFLYFASMIFSIIIYYTFTSVQYNAEVLKVVAQSDSSTRAAAMASALQAASIVIAIFSAIFIWYSSSFFTRKRKKEIGLYSMMGVKKKQIGRMLFYENIAMGALALVIGILLGSLLSKLFIMLLIRLMGFSASVKFAIIPKAILNTAIAFAVIFFISSIHSYTIIYRFKLIELFNAEKSKENEPKASLVLALLSVLCIGFGYWFYLYGLKLTNNFLLLILVTLILTIMGTYFFFSSFVVYMIKVSKLNRKRYFRGINMIGSSQLLYRIKSQSRTLATIAVLSASTLTALSVISSMYYDLTINAKKNYPFTYSYISNDKSIDKKVGDIIAKYPKNKTLKFFEGDIVSLKGRFPGKEKDGDIKIISESKYNELADITGKEKVSISSSNETILFESSFVKGFMDDYTDKNIVVSIKNSDRSLKVIAHKNGEIFNTLMYYDVLVVKDELFNEAYSSGSLYRTVGYMNDNRKNSKELTDELIKFMEVQNVKKLRTGAHISAYYPVYVEQLRINGLIIFIGAFLGLVFLTATGSIIFFKQLSEANDDKYRYKILKNIGVSKKEITLSISKQMLFVFLLPLLVGAVHSLVAITLLSKMLASNLIVPVAVTIGIYTVIYFVYYLLTVSSYSKLVNTNA